MKKFNLMLTIIAAVLLCACKGGNTLSPVSEKIQGPLSEYFEVVSKDYKVKDGKVSIEIKRIKAGFPSPWQESMEVGYSDGYFEPHFTVEFQDADGNVVSKDKTDIVQDRDELETIANLGVDESATITFNCGEDACKFKMGSTFKVHGEQDRTVNLEGNIGKYPIMMTMHIAPDGIVTGAYYYKSKGPGNYLYVKGEKTDDRITLNEFTKDGQQTGTYDGTYKNDVYKGHFNTKSGNYAFVLRPTEMESIDLALIDFDSYYAEYVKYDDGDDSDDSDEEDDSYESYDNSSAGSANWDEILKSYEQYVDKYISLMKKASKGDMSATLEYVSFMKKAQDLSSKMQNAQGEMSPDQWARYMKILSKMTNAMQEME